MQHEDIRVRLAKEIPMVLLETVEHFYDVIPPFVQKKNGHLILMDLNRWPTIQARIVWTTKNWMRDDNNEDVSRLVVFGLTETLNEEIRTLLLRSFEFPKTWRCMGNYKCGMSFQDGFDHNIDIDFFSSINDCELFEKDLIIYATHIKTPYGDTLPECMCCVDEPMPIQFSRWKSLDNRKALEILYNDTLSREEKDSVIKQVRTFFIN